MSPLPKIASLWIGGQLSWLEQLCLQSYLDNGHDVTLFVYDEVKGVPDGVRVSDANAIYPSTEFIRHKRTGSPAYHADVFRLHMLEQTDLIWVDTDAYCCRPFALPESGHLHGRISDPVFQVNNGVLRLPKDSATLAEMRAFTSDEYPIPPWYKPAKQEALARRKEAGDGLHVSELPWGVWGPDALTHFLVATGEIELTQPKHVLYPVPFGNKRSLLRPHRRSVVEEWVKADTLSIHFWGRRFRAAVSETGGVPVEGSYTLDLLRKHGIDPAPTAHMMKPVAPRGKAAPIEEKTPAPQAATPPEGVDSSVTGFRRIFGDADIGAANCFADLTGAEPAAAIAAHERFDCDIVLVAAGDAAGDWVDDARAAMIGGGVPANRIRIARDLDGLKPATIVSALGTSKVTARAGRLEPFLAPLTAEGGVVLSDIRQGSGGFPFMRRFGEPVSVAIYERDGRPVHRVLTTIEPAATGQADLMAWARVARGMLGADGFHREGGNHALTYVPRGRTLAVTFDNLDIAMNKREDRRPWGFKFIEDQGWSMLGVLANGWTWYRDPWVTAEFARLRDEGFFDRFDQVVFYGASMGGYGALTLSAFAPGADVVVFSPQTVLDKEKVPWEARYRIAWGYDWSGLYADAADTVGAARSVNLLYDPYSKPDARHVARLSGGNIRHLRMPFFGHRAGSLLQKMGLLQPAVLGAISGELTERAFERMLRARRGERRYRKEMVDRLLDRGRFAWAAGLSRRFLEDGPDSFFQEVADKHG